MCNLVHVFASSILNTKAITFDFDKVRMAYKSVQDILMWQGLRYPSKTLELKQAYVFIFSY